MALTCFSTVVLRLKLCHEKCQVICISSSITRPLMTLCGCFFLFDMEGSLFFPFFNYLRIR